MYVYEYLPWKQEYIAINTVDIYRTILLEIYKHTNKQMQIVMSPIILLFRGKNIKKGKSFWLMKLNGKGAKVKGK